MKKEKKTVYTFRVLNDKGHWEGWTGSFDSIENVMIWFFKHGQFHIDNNHTLGLFKNAELIEVMKGKPKII